MSAQQTRADMEEKYTWAYHSNGTIQQQALLYKTLGHANYSNNFSEVKHAFWAFIEAYYQIRAHHGKWAELITGQKKQKDLLDRWKFTYLTPEQIDAWKALADFRNDNAHKYSVLPNISLRQVVRITHDGRIRITHDGGIRGAATTYLAVSMDGKDYDLPQLTTIGLLLLRRFIDTFDQIT